MAGVVSFRPTQEEADLIETTRRACGFRTRAEAVRHLIRKGANEKPDWRNDPLFKLRFPELAKPGEVITSDSIDRELYGGA